jgi:cell wall-associated NlpC family hydrolase
MAEAGTAVSRLDATAAPRPVGLGASTARISNVIVTEPPPSAIAISFARAQLGKAYVWGATGPNTFDCSGLTLRAYEAAGIQLPRTSAQQARVGHRIPASAGLSALAPGDLVFWAYRPGNLSTVHHVAIHLGDGHIIHAPQRGDVVRISTIWAREYAGGTRVA